MADGRAAGAERNAGADDDRDHALLPPEAPVLPPARLSRAVQASLMILAALALLWAMREAQLFLMPTVLAALAALAATPLCARLERLGLPSSVAALIVTVSILVGVVSVGWNMLPSLDEWRFRAPEVAISLERKIRRIERQVEEVTDTVTSVAPEIADQEPPKPAAGAANPDESAEEEEEEKRPTEQILEGGRQMVVSLAAAAPEVLGALVYGFFLMYFLMAERGRVRRWAMMMAANRRQAARIGRTVNETRLTVGRYLATVSMINIALGAVTAAAFWSIDMPAPILWGVFMTLMNFMPYLGPLVVQACAFAVGFVTFNSLGEALLAPAVLLVLNVLEGQLLTPTILGRRLSASPLAVFLAVAFGAWMWGAVGAIVATPALIVGSSFVSLWAREALRQKRHAEYAAQTADPEQ